MAAVGGQHTVHFAPSVPASDIVTPAPPALNKGAAAGPAGGGNVLHALFMFGHDVEMLRGVWRQLPNSDNRFGDLSVALTSARRIVEYVQVLLREEERTR